VRYPKTGELRDIAAALFFLLRFLRGEGAEPVRQLQYICETVQIYSAHPIERGAISTTVYHAQTLQGLASDAVERERICSNN